LRNLFTVFLGKLYCFCIALNSKSAFTENLQQFTELDYKAVKDRLLLGMQDFDFAQI